VNEIYTDAAPKLDMEELRYITVRLLVETDPKKIDSLMNVLKRFVKVRPHPAD
jgi:hypothetical protein